MNRNYYHNDHNNQHHHQMLYNNTSYQMPNGNNGAQVLLQPLNSLTNDLMSPQSSVTSTSFLAAANTIVLGTSTSPSSYPTPPGHMMNMMVGGGMSASVNAAANHNDTLIRRLKQQQLDQSDMLDFELHLADGGGGGGGGLEGGGGVEQSNADGANQDEALANGPAKQASFFNFNQL